MKKTVIIALLLVASATFAFASGNRETVTVEGKLAVTDSVPTISAGGKTYELPIGPFYRIAWEKSIKIGDTVKIEGTAVENPGRRAAPSSTTETVDRTVLMPSKLWVNGKEIDLSAFDMGGGRMGGGRMGGNNAGDCANCDSSMMGGRGSGRTGGRGMGNR